MSVRDDFPLRHKLGLSLAGKSSAGTKGLGAVLARNNRPLTKNVPVYNDKDVIETKGSVRSSADKIARESRDEYKARVWVKGPDGRPVQIMNTDLYSQGTHSLAKVKDYVPNKASPFGKWATKN